MRLWMPSAMGMVLLLDALCPAQQVVDRLGDPLPHGATQRLGTLRMRYRGVGGLSYLPDGRGVVLTGGHIHIWNLAEGTIESDTRVSSTSLVSVELREDGQALLLADTAGKVYEWNPVSTSTTQTWETEQGGLRSARYSPDRKRFLVAGNTPMGYMEYDIESGVRTAAGGVEFAVTRCGAIYGPDGTTVIMGGGYDHLLEHRVLATGELLKKWATNYEAKQIRLSPGRNTILVGTEAYAEEYNLADYSLLYRYDPVSGEAGRCFAHDFAARRNEAVLGLRTGSIHRYDRATGREVFRWMAHSGLISAVAVSPDEKRVVTFGGGLLVESELDTGRPTVTWQRHSGPVQALAFTPDGDRVISGSADATLRVWDPRTGESLMLIEGATLGAYALAVSSDASRVAAGCKDGAIREFALADGVLLRELRGHLGFIRSVAYSADAATLVSCADDGSVRIWQADSQEAVATLQGHLGGVLSVALSADNRRLLSGGRDGTVRLWDVPEARMVRRHDRHRGWVEAVAFAGQDRWAVSTGRDGRVLRWDLHTEEFSGDMDNGGWTYAMAVSPDGDIVHCSAANGINSWKLSENRKLAELRGHDAGVRTVAVSPDGKLIATGSSDTSVLVWEAPSAP